VTESDPAAKWGSDYMVGQSPSMPKTVWSGHITKRLATTGDLFHRAGFADIHADLCA